MEARTEEELMTKSWVITVPKTRKWSDYLREVAEVEDGRAVMNYRIRGFPKAMRQGDRCYVVHDGQVRGWMTLVGLVEKPKPWRGTTTGQIWKAGRFIQRSGPFHPLKGGPKMTGFRGARTPPTRQVK